MISREGRQFSVSVTPVWNEEEQRYMMGMRYDTEPLGELSSTGCHITFYNAQTGLFASTGHKTFSETSYETKFDEDGE